MISWVVGLVVADAVILAVVIVLVVAVYLYRQGEFPGLKR
jgi:hypothetical protein